ncbi:MAG TPA: LamG-like jellyroll fold domain-containing protein [Verrucomicrobiae bacterium]
MNRTLFVLLLVAFAPLCLPAADVTFAYVTKGQSWTQTGPASYSRTWADKYTFNARVYQTSPGAVVSASITLPNSIALPCYYTDSQQVYYVWTTDDDIGLSGFNTNFPNGEYKLRVQTLADGIRTFSLNLTGDAYATIPLVQNFGQCQSIDPAKPFNLQWVPFDGGTTSDFIFVQIEAGDQVVFQTGMPGQQNALNGLATSVTIPANTFAPGTEYRLGINFLKLRATDIINYPGVPGYAGYSQWNSLSVRTISSNQLPSIVEQPQSQTVTEWATATFSVVATGTPPLTYAWQKDSVPIPGATNSTYSLTAARLTDAGHYSVVVSNVAGAITSQPCDLVVTPLTYETNLVLSLDGTSAYVSVPSAADLQNPAEFTVEAWIYPQAGSQNNSLFINKSDNLVGNSERSYELQWVANADSAGPGTSVRFIVFLNNGDWTWVDAGAAENTWVHIAGCFSSTQGVVQLFINGVLAETTTRASGTPLAGTLLRQTALPVRFGRAEISPSLYAHGFLDEVRIWSKARTQTEVRESMYCRLSGSEPNLAGYWSFDSGNAADLTGHGHHGTLFGTAATVPISGEDVVHALCGRPVLEIHQVGGSQAELCWGTLTTNWYQLQYKSALATNQWVPFTPNWLAGDGNRFCTNDTVLPGQAQRFYRVVVTNSTPQ